MDIERLNDHTIRFFISYHDIEDRGFNRDEIWEDRERSEELFWEIMDEIDELDESEELSLDGPLWIQVQAVDKGVEVIVVVAQISEDGEMFELRLSDEQLIELPLEDQIDSLVEQIERLEQYSGENKITTEVVPAKHKKQEERVVRFNDFEDLIQLSSSFKQINVSNSLYFYENFYYLLLECKEETKSVNLDQLCSVVFEFGEKTKLTPCRLMEYGKLIINEHALQLINEKFNQKS